MKIQKTLRGKYQLLWGRLDRVPERYAASICPFRMKDVDRVIDELLVERPAGFGNKHLAEALGVSRSRACRILAIRVLSGELAREGEGVASMSGE